MPPINNDWLEPLKPEFGKPYYKKLYQKINEEYQSRLIFPPADDIFNAFAFTPLKDVKVVILGQDPYHGDGQAHGLCFSVKPDVEIPPSLVNIYKELPDKMGKSGGAAFEYGSDRACPPGEFPSRDWLGRVYGRGNPHFE